MFYRGVLAAVAACFACAPASAATIIRTADYDAPYIHPVFGIAKDVDLNAPIDSVAVGDTIEVTINFLQPVSFHYIPISGGPGRLAAGLEVSQAPQAYTDLGPATFSLGGSTGDLITSGAAITLPATTRYLRELQIVDPAHFTGGSFTSLTLNYDVTTAFNAPISRVYTALIFAVPEPATWAMMIAGFGLVGGAMRTRRSASSRRAALR